MLLSLAVTVIIQTTSPTIAAKACETAGFYNMQRYHSVWICQALPTRESTPTSNYTKVVQR